MTEDSLRVAERVREVLLLLARWGVREVCLAAGARNIPLVKGVLASSGLKVWHFFEERSMAFFALGRVMASGQPVAVVTTSGTAAVELMPAIVEAYYQALPLIAITADRPAHYRGSGAPQAIEQRDLFGVYAPCLDVTEEATLPISVELSGPIQVNVCLPEAAAAPVAAVDFCLAEVDVVRAPLVQKPFELGPIDLVLVAGVSDREGEELSSFLLRLGAPVLAEATACIPGIEALLLRGGERALAGMKVGRVLRIGAVPSWRWWRDLEDRPEVEVVQVSNAPFTGLARQRGEKVHTIAELLLADCPAREMSLSSPAGHGASLDALLERFPLSEPAWMRHLSSVVPQDAVLFLGNSLPIREWNLAGRIPGSQRCYACRGTNGIDGIVSTFLGTAAEGGEAWLVLGDLSALYDLAAPWVLGQLPEGRRRLVVINNGGGKIFSRVPSLASLDEGTRSVIENAHQVDFAGWAALWKLPYRRITKPEELLLLPQEDVLVEIVPDLKETEALLASL